MKKEMFVGKYKNNILAKKSKVFLSSLLDYFLVVITTFIIFVAVANPICTALPFFNNNLDNLSNITTNLYKIVSETRLQAYDEETNSLKDISIDSNAYVEALVKTSFFVYNEPYPLTFNEETGQYIFENIEVLDTFYQKSYNNISFPHDNLSYYYFDFKESNDSLNSYIYDDKDYQNNKSDFLYKEVLDLNNPSLNNYFLTSTEYDLLEEKYKEIDRYQILNLDAAKMLMSYIVYKDRGEEITALYTNLNTAYQNAVQFFIDEVENNYSPYLEKLSDFNNSYNTYVISYIISLSLSYLLSYLIFIVIIPIFLKDHKTLSFKIMKLGICRYDEFEPAILNYVINKIFIFVLYFNGVFFSLLFMNLLPISSFNIYGSGFSYFQVILFSALLGILSYLFLIVSRNNQLLSLFGGNMVLKNTEEFENNISATEKIDNKEEINDEQRA